MNLFKRVGNFFKKKRKKKKFIPINIFVPTREDLIENGQDQMVEMLDQYKKEYREKLKQRLLLGDISSRDLINQYLENQDLILQHVKSNPYLHVDELLASGNAKELFDVKIKYLKLFLLSQENIKIYKEIMLRYVALKEIINKTTFFSPNKKRAIFNEFDFLYHALVVCSSNNFATNKDCQLYLVRIQEINEHLKESTIKEKEYSSKRLSLDTKLASYFAKDAKEKVFGHNMDELGIISYLEVELEKYLYEHKEEFEKIEESLREIEAIECTSENKKYLEETIGRLEIKFLLLNRIKGVPRERMHRLYQKKFEILTCGLSVLDDSVIDKKDYGYGYYKEIVKEKVYNILNGHNAYFNHQIGLNSIKEKFKMYYSDIDEVLLGKYKLATLLSFDKENGFSELLSKTMIRKNDFDEIHLFWPKDAMDKYYYCFLETPLQNKKTGIVWHDEIPLETFLSVAEAFFPGADFFFNNMYRSSYVYRQKHENCIKNSYSPFPEGIKKMDFRYSNNWNFFEEFSVYDTPLFPSSVKEVKNLPTHTPSRDIGIYTTWNRFPDGLEKIAKDDNWSNWCIELEIPPSVETIDVKVPLSLSLKFKNFKQSVFLHSKEKLMEFLMENYRTIWEEGYRGYCIYEEIYITIYDDHENPIEINFCDDKSQVKFPRGADSPEKLYEFIDNQADRIRDIIREKTGHSIFQEDYQHKG